MLLVWVGHFSWLNKPWSEIIFLFWLTCSQKMLTMSGWFPSKKEKKETMETTLKNEKCNELKAVFEILWLTIPLFPVPSTASHPHHLTREWAWSAGFHSLNPHPHPPHHHHHHHHPISQKGGRRNTWQCSFLVFKFCLTNCWVKVYQLQFLFSWFLTCSQLVSEYFQNEIEKEQYSHYQSVIECILY